MFIGIAQNYRFEQITIDDDFFKILVFVYCKIKKDLYELELKTGSIGMMGIILKPLEAKKIIQILFLVME